MFFQILLDARIADIWIRHGCDTWFGVLAHCQATNSLPGLSAFLFANGSECNRNELRIVAQACDVNGANQSVQATLVSEPDPRRSPVEESVEKYEEIAMQWLKEQTQNN